MEGLQKSLATRTRQLEDLRAKSELKITALRKSLAARDKIISGLRRQVERLEEENEYLFEDYSKHHSGLTPHRAAAR